MYLGFPAEILVTYATLFICEKTVFSDTPQFDHAYSNAYPTRALYYTNKNKKCCLAVDELLSQQQVVVKSLGSGLEAVEGISGGAIIGDGKVSLRETKVHRTPFETIRLWLYNQVPASLTSMAAVWQ